MILAASAAAAPVIMGRDKNETGAGERVGRAYARGAGGEDGASVDSELESSFALSARRKIVLEPSQDSKYNVSTFLPVGKIFVKRGVTVTFFHGGGESGEGREGGGRESIDLEVWNVTIFGKMVLVDTNLVIRGLFALGCDGDGAGDV